MKIVVLLGLIGSGMCQFYQPQPPSYYQPQPPSYMGRPATHLPQVSPYYIPQPHYIPQMTPQQIPQMTPQLPITVNPLPLNSFTGFSPLELTQLPPVSFTGSSFSGFSPGMIPASDSPVPSNPVAPGVNSNIGSFLNAPLMTFAGTGSGQIDGNGLFGAVGDGTVGFDGVGGTLFFGNGRVSGNGDGSFNAMTSPQGISFGTFLGDGRIMVDGQGGVVSFGDGMVNFNGNGWMFGQGQVRSSDLNLIDGSVRIGDNQITDERDSRTFPATATTQAIFNPLNTYVNSGLAATRNLAVSSLTQLNNLNTNSIATTQALIDGLFNGLRNTNTFKPGGANKFVIG